MNGLDKILIAPTCKRFYDIIKFQKTGLITFKKNEEVKNFTQHNIQKKTFRYRYTQYFNIIELDLTKVWVDLSDIKRILSCFPNLESIKLSFHASDPDLCNILIELSPYITQVNENLQKVFVQQEFSWLCFRKNEHYVLSKENLQKASNEKYERKKLDIKKKFHLVDVNIRNILIVFSGGAVFPIMTICLYIPTRLSQRLFQHIIQHIETLVSCL